MSRPRAEPEKWSGEPRCGFVNAAARLFKWASEGRPLIAPDGRTATVVHPYDAKWGRLIAPGLRTPLP